MGSPPSPAGSPPQPRLECGICERPLTEVPGVPGAYVCNYHHDAVRNAELRTGLRALIQEWEAQSSPEDSYAGGGATIYIAAVIDRLRGLLGGRP